MTRFPHGADVDREHELDGEAERRAHDAGECGAGCSYCEENLSACCGAPIISDTDICSMCREHTGRGEQDEPDSKS